MGGLVSREAIRQKKTGNISVLITVGTPHTGAPLAKNINSLVTRLGYWLGDVAWGLLAYFYNADYAADIANEALDPLASVIGTLASEYVSSSYPCVSDMKPGSAFMTALNKTPSSTLPTGHEYAIYTQEDWHTLWRYGDSRIIDGTEQGNLAHVAYGAAGLWGALAVVSWSVAEYYYNRYLDTGNLLDYEQFVRFQEVGVAFAWGAYSLGYLQQFEYSTLIQETTVRSEDGIVPVSSQSPTFISAVRKRFADGVNHHEQRYHTKTLDLVWEILEVNEQVPPK